jgi:hypothetical protein
MKCPEDCNSDGIWPIQIAISISNIENGAAKLTYFQSRGWTPTNGGLKPFNYFMDYNIEVYYTVIKGMTGTGRAGARGLRGLQEARRAKRPERNARGRERTTRRLDR